jgi:hypothetical protein
MTKGINDCRECANFHWDFEEGRFFCERARDRQVEDLHIIPDWCPLAGKMIEATLKSFAASTLN